MIRKLNPEHCENTRLEISKKKSTHHSAIQKARDFSLLNREKYPARASTQSPLRASQVYHSFSRPLATKRPFKMFDRISIVLRDIGLRFLAPRPSPSRILDGHQTSVFHTKLPIEVIYIIFGFVFNNSYSPIRPSSSLRLACVCREWQTLIFFNPLFWRTISLLYSEESWSSEDNLYAEEWLMRSRNLPLTISLRMAYNRVQANNRLRSFDSVDHLINLIAQNRCRWQDLSLDLPLHHLNRFLSYLSGPKNSAILLRSLCIQVHRFRSQDLRPSVWMLSLQSARKLLPSYLTLLLDSPPPIEINRSLLELFMSNRLRKISIGPITARSLFDIIASSENLEVADVEIKPELQNGVATIHYIPPPPIRTVLRLQELSIVESDTSFDIDAGNGRLLEWLLKTFTLPSLNTLEYKGPIFLTSVIDVTEISEFISRSGCSLVTLMLLRIAIRGGEVTPIFKNMPHLRKLGLDTNYDSDPEESGEALLTDDFFNNLWAEPPLLPCLVHFFYEGPLTFSWESVVGVLDNALAQTDMPCRSIPEYLKIDIQGPLPDYPPHRLFYILQDLRLKGRCLRKVKIQHEGIDITPLNPEMHHRMHWLEFPIEGRLSTVWGPKKWV